MTKGSLVQTADAELMRAINRFQVLDTIRRFEPISRVEIGEGTRLSRATVSLITADLIAEELIVLEDVAPPQGGTRGRPRLLLRLNPNAAFVVGVKLSMHQISILVTNLRADVLESLVLPVRISRLAPDVVVDLLEDGIRNLVAKAGLDIAQIAGIGIGIPGFINSATGICHWSPIFGYGELPFAAMVQARLRVLTRIENDANLVTLAERWFGLGQDVEDFVVVTIEHGVGLGIFLNGELYRGHDGIGAEFGHTKFDPHGPACRCGQSGCIEAYAADYAILRDAASFLKLGDISDDIVAFQAIRRVTELAKGGNARLAALFHRAGEVLGFGVANLINVLNPARIIISGGGVRAGAWMFDSLRQTVAQQVSKPFAERLDIVVRESHEWGDEVWARGAASLVLQEMYRSPWTRITRQPTQDLASS